MNSDARRGIVIGLWVLTGLAFLLDVLLPGSTGSGVLGPGLLAAAVASTTLFQHALDQKPVERRNIALGLLGALLAFGTAFAVISEGDRRSFLYVALVTMVTSALSFSGPRRAKARRGTPLGP